MRILQVSSARNYGGGERHFVDLCRGLHTRGHSVFAALRPTNRWQNRLDFLPPENLLHVSIRNSFGVLSAIRIAEFVKKNGVEIIHAHLARDYIPASIACLASERSKFVLTRHVMFPLKAFNRYALGNISRAIAVSEAAAEQLRSVFPAEKVCVIPNGIDVDAVGEADAAAAGRAFRDDHNIGRDEPLVGTLGELKELKGQRDFVLAAAEIAKDFPAARFVVVGTDNAAGQSFRRELKRLVSVLGLAEKFLWLDWLDDTAGFYSAIDVFVSPSRSESFGLAILEAMLNATAVVATATDGARELFGDMHTGVPIGEPVRMAAAVGELLGDERARIALGERLRRRAAEKYSLARMIEAVETVYNEI